MEQWIELINGSEKVYPSTRIPYDAWLDEYLLNINDKSDIEVKNLLRLLLQPFTTRLDVMLYDGIVEIINDEIRWNALSEKDKAMYTNMFTNIEKNRRLESGFEAWDGLSWVLQLLPFYPFKAIRALNAYLDAEIVTMPDDRIIGINQSIEIIEAKYITEIRDSPASIIKENALLSLKPRKFEMLIEDLYQQLGYDTVLTPTSRDGGKDVIATIKREDGIERVYVECKLYKTTRLKTESVNALYGVICKDNINRGVMYCTGYISNSIRTHQERINIISLEEIITLLNDHLGYGWEKRIST